MLSIVYSSNSGNDATLLAKGLSKDASTTPNMFQNIRNQFLNPPEIEMAQKSREQSLNVILL